MAWALMDPRAMKRAPVVVAWAWAALLASCGPPSTDKDAAQPGDAGALEPDAGTVAAVPKVVFLAQRNGTATPVEEVIYAEPVVARFEGLTPGEHVLLHARLWGYHSVTEFEVGADGVVDLGRDAPLGGDYQGVDPDGPIWSMIKENNSFQQHYNVDFTIERDGAVVLERTLVRLPLGMDATVRNVTELGLVGRLYVPPGPPRGVVVVVGGSEGGLEASLFNAAYVETMGYAALALAYFGTEGVPEQLTEIPLEYFETAFQWLQTQPDVDGNHVVMMGGSRGGELALLVGATFPQHVDGVVATVPSGVVFGSTADDTRSAWSRASTPVPYWNVSANVPPVTERLPGGTTGYRYAPGTQMQLETLKQDAQALARVSIPVENTAGPVLMVAAGDDGLWPSCALMDVAWQRLAPRGNVLDRAVCLEDAGHLVGTPGWPTSENYVTTMYGQFVILGETPQGNGRGGRVFDLALREFLNAVLNQP